MFKFLKKEKIEEEPERHYIDQRHLEKLAVLRDEAKNKKSYLSHLFLWNFIDEIVDIDIKNNDWRLTGYPLNIYIEKVN